MKATIWHNPACGTSRKTLAILESLSGVELTVVEYLKTPPGMEKLAQLYRDAGITPQQGLRLRGTDAEERGLPDADDATVLAAMVALSSLAYALPLALASGSAEFRYLAWPVLATLASALLAITGNRRIDPMGRGNALP